MKVVVLGAGLMGKEVARDLVESGKVEKVYLADVDLKIAQQSANQLNSEKVEPLEVNAKNDEALRQTMKKGDVCVNALFYEFNEKVAKTAIEIGVHSVDLGGHIGEVTENVLKLDDDAKAKNVTIIPDLGVAPGMINILTGYAASKMDEVKSIKLYVGGIPLHPEPPLNYALVFSLEGLFDHYTEPAKIIENGKLREVDSLSGVEEIYFDKFGKLEAFYTSGGVSTLYKTFPNVNTLLYKTIRYKGHAEQFTLFKKLGLLDKSNTIKMNDMEIKVRDVIREALKKQLTLGDKQDVVLLRVIVSGEKHGEQVTYEYETTIIRKDGSSMTAMAKATSCTISTVAIMIGSGIITKRGVFPPELIVPGNHYIEEMAKRGVTIKETFHRSSIVNW